MTEKVLRHYHGSDRQFAAIFAFSWVGYTALSLCMGSSEWSAAMVSAVFASALSLMVLRFLGYFDPLRLFPRRSDVLLSLAATALGGVLQVAVLRLLYEQTLFPAGCLALYTPILSLVIFGGHYYWSRRLLQKGARRKVVLSLSSTERQRIVEEYIWKGMARYLEFLSIHDLRRHILEGREHEISMIILSNRCGMQFDADALLIRAHLAGVPILDYRHVAAESSGKVLISDSDLWSYLMQATPQTRLFRLLTVLKYVTEPIIASVLAVLLAPLMLVVALLVKLTSPGPVLYRQVRTGYLGRTFELVKFRSMVANAEKDGPQWSGHNDSRLTRFGAFLRKTRLDELPQLWNVIRGEMSFVGPRPERPEIYAQLKEHLPLFAMRLIVRPGITGWAQVCAGYAATVEESRRKLKHDLYYIQHLSPRLDLVILPKTVLVMFAGGTEAERSSSEKEPEAVVA